MDRDKLIERLRGTFLLELEEHVRVFNRELLALEKAGSAGAAAESVRTLFRTAHSLKGAARAVNATRLAGVCHRLEELLAALRDGTRPLTPEIIATLFAAVDTFESTGREFGSAAASSDPAPARPSTGMAAPPPTAAGRREPPPAGGIAGERGQGGVEPAAIGGGRGPAAAGGAGPSGIGGATGNGPGPAAVGGGLVGSGARAAGVVPAAVGAGGSSGVVVPAAVGGGSSGGAPGSPASGERPGPASSRASSKGIEARLAGLGGSALDPVPAPPSPEWSLDTGPAPAAISGERRADVASTTSRPSTGSLNPAALASSAPPASRDTLSPGGATLHPNVEAESQVRVPARKLDDLLAQSGELLIARRRFEARLGQLGTLQERFAEVRRQWNTAAAATSTHAPAARSRGLRRGQAALRLVGESLGPHEARASRALERFPLELATLDQQLMAATNGLREEYRALERVAETLEERIHRVRMLPFVQATEGLQRAVRDLARAQSKLVDLTIAGGETELDRAILDALRDPLLHIVRNAVDHGVESPAQRTAAGKSERAEIRVSASLQGEQVCVTVSDDGRGIDFEAVYAAARKRSGGPGMVTENPRLLIFEPGVSTAAVVSEVSGRGVGLDVVKTQVEALRGSVEVSSELGRGAQFQLLLPLTLTTQRVLFVRAGSEIYALPSTGVRSLRRAVPSELTFLDGREVLLLGAAPIPIVVLAELLGSPRSAQPASAKVPLVVIGQQDQALALAVDELLSEQEVVCKPLGKRIARVPLVSAATVLPTGQIALLLQPAQLVRAALGRQPAQRVALVGVTAQAPARKRVLLVDDSATTRTLERSILEAAGYDVLVAVDGTNAYAILQEHTIDLVISDVEMPNMDGFALTEAIRSSRRLGALPVVLLTSLDSDADREHGMRSGANAYLAKSAFDQTHLLDTIRELL